jgi:hypothetical protein
MVGCEATIPFPKRRMHSAEVDEQEPYARSVMERFTTRECEELNALSKLNGWEADYQQLGRGAFEALEVA